MIEIIFPEKGKTNLITEIDLETMQGIEIDPNTGELSAIDLSMCEIRIKPLKS